MDEPIQPVVLVGGRSRRFGRDKLLEPVDGGVLVDRPIAALREVFGPRVVTVGDADPRVAARADGAIWDRYPGVGPIGGILSVLEATGIAVFVLSGDLAGVDAALVRAVLARAALAPQAWAVLARGDRAEPCVGLYRNAAAGALAARLRAGRSSLHDALPAHAVELAAVAPERVVNVNDPRDLPAVGL